MLTVVKNENSNTISIPAEEMEKLGISDGVEVELSKNESGEIILRQKDKDRKNRILQATREIIEERKSALIELGKGHE
jgi:antitoxin component of MazEF toxin-antitoxin module